MTTTIPKEMKLESELRLDLSAGYHETDTLPNLRFFLEQFCHNLGIAFHWISGSVAQLEIDNETASLIDGPRTPGYTCTLSLHTPPSGIEAELFTPGSYRWDSFLAITRQKAQLAHQYVVGIPGFLEDNSATELETDGGQLVYEPHLLSHWRLSYRTGRISKNRVLDLTVNLVTGRSELSYYRSLLHCHLHDHPLPWLAKAKRQLSFKGAYSIMSQQIQYFLAREDPSWAKAASGELRNEIDALKQYYVDRLAKEGANELLLLEKTRRIEELKERSQPRVMASPFATTLIYIPIISYQISMGGETLCLRFDPISNQALH